MEITNTFKLNSRKEKREKRMENTKEVFYFPNPEVETETSNRIPPRV